MNLKLFNHSTRSGLRAWPLGLSTWLGPVLAATVCTTSLPAQPQLPEASGAFTIKVVEPPEGTTTLWLFSINNSDMVVSGYYTTNSLPSGCGETAILEKGVWKPVHASVPKAAYAYTGPTNPNDSGQIAVCYNDAAHAGGCICHHAIYHNGKLTPFGANGYPTYEGWNWCLSAINDSDVVYGYAWDSAESDSSGNHLHGLLVNASLSLFEVFDPPGSGCTSTSPGAINKHGTVVGQYLKWTGPGRWDGTWHGFVSDLGKTCLDVDVPAPSQNTLPEGINDKGEICGAWNEAASVANWYASGTHGFLLLNGTFSTFNISGSSWTLLDRINAKGQLAGVYADQNGNPHGFIATPKPVGK
jgi:hypothetical protein